MSNSNLNYFACFSCNANFNVIKCNRLQYLSLKNNSAPYKCVFQFLFLGRINMNAPTIKDVANAAGVSVATISRVLSNPDLVKPATKEHVLQIIKEMNYQPNVLARQLRTQTTRAVIVIVPNIENSFFHGILSGIGTEAERQGYQMLIADLKSQPSLEKHYIEAIKQRQVDGIISLSANMTQKLETLITERYPLVMVVQCVPNYKIPSVSIDNMAASKALMTHLIRLGHREIAHLTVSPLQMPYQDRLNGYISALEEHKIPVDNELISYGEPAIKGGYDQMWTLLAKQKKFTAVFAAGDTMAIGAMKALKDQGLRVPEDCAVVGFDDIDLSSVWEPAITTIRQPKEMMGRIAFQKLLALMQNEPIAVSQEYLPYELVIRESCGYFL